MKIKHQLPLQRLIGKIDNDFNIDQSDWIPRVGAWVTDALSQLKVLPMERKRRTLEVIDRIATFPCILNAKEIKVFTKEGCEIPEASDTQHCNCNSNSSSSSSTGEVIAVTNPNADSYLDTTIVANITTGRNRNFVISNDNQIELNFDTDCIIVESYEVAKYFDDYFNCEVPYIYDNGDLLEALAYYCLFKMLARGYKHQTYSLQSGQQYLNPYQIWLSLKSKATASVRNDMFKDKGWSNFFYNSTFRPRD